MRLYSVRTAYHSTKQKGLSNFKPFTDDEVAYKGEGAQIHGWGLYLQEDKEINRLRYKNNLGTVMIPSNEFNCLDVYIFIDKRINYCPDELSKGYNFLNDFCFTEMNKIIENKNKFNGDMNESSISINDIDSFISWIIDLFRISDTIKNNLNELKSRCNQIVCEIQRFNTFAEPSQYTIEIPDTMNLIGQENNINWNDSIIKSICDDFGIDNINEKKEKLLKEVQLSFTELSYETIESLFDYYWKNGVDSTISYCSSKIDYESLGIDWYKLGYMIERYFPSVGIELSGCDSTYEDLYDTICGELGGQKEGSEYLMNHGIDGMEYHGGTDGHCYVIFSCSKLNIIKEE